MYAQWRDHKESADLLLASGALEDISETPEEKQREKERLEDYGRDLDLAKQEFLSRPENQSAIEQWAGAWASIVGPGSGTYVFHKDGAVMLCIHGRVREVAHLEDNGNGTMLYRLPNGKATKIERWSVTEEGKLMLDYGNFIAVSRRL